MKFSGKPVYELVEMQEDTEAPLMCTIIMQEMYFVMFTKNAQEYYLIET